MTTRIIQGDCVDRMGLMDLESVDLVFADPPFNIGYKYDTYKDNLPYHKYLEWSEEWISEARRILKPDGTMWLAIGDDYAAELKLAARDEGFHCRSWVIWFYTFGVNCTKKFTRSHTHLFHFVKDENNFTFNVDPIKVPSARQLVYKDKRAKKGGRLPDDTWLMVLRPQEIEEDLTPDKDLWHIPRVCGSFKERTDFHGCQMPEQLLARIIRASSNEGDVVCDPFAGSGSTLCVAKKLNRRSIGIELSTKYVPFIRERLEKVNVGDAIDGKVQGVE